MENMIVKTSYGVSFTGRYYTMKTINKPWKTINEPTDHTDGYSPFLAWIA